MGKEKAIVPPVAMGDPVTLQVERLGYRGEGVARYRGFTIFVEGALPGETVEAQITQVKRSFAIAELRAIVHPTSERVVPLCPVFDVCGGCQLQHLSYAAQLQFKRQVVKDALVRIGKFAAEDVQRWVQPVIGQEEPWRYRNKVSLTATARAGRFVAGFVEEGTHEPVESTTCLIRPHAYDELLQIIITQFEQHGVRAYDEQSQSGDVRQLIVRSNHKHEVMIVILTGMHELVHGRELAAAWAKQMPQGYRLVSVIQQKRNDGKNGVRKRDASEEVLYGDASIQEQIDGLTFRISASAFLQVNPIQTRILYEKALNAAAISSQDVVFDFYCGVGTLSLLAGRQAKAVYGVESVSAAVEDAKFNARQNGLTNAHFYAGFVEQVAPQLLSSEVHPNVILLDPPRAGCGPEVITALLQASPQRIVYISCNPATLARDLRQLVDGGYALQSVEPIDMFPQTAHVEVISSIVLKK
ncbi:23S rRNA (uracil(1939)-C(5))-methyltransferase RlmD [Sulfoacidibacillus thermotolerans]|nr:23S rRNA (uracil(1939)-C(5))-methyltransferase RlmD [Sulfoacidibacillus thermotolerans]